MTDSETRSPRLRVYSLQAEASRAMNALAAAWNRLAIPTGDPVPGSYQPS